MLLLHANKYKLNSLCICTYEEVDQQDFDDGWTALMHAIKSNQAKNVAKLISNEKCGMNVQSWVRLDCLFIWNNLIIVSIVGVGDRMAPVR